MSKLSFDSVDVLIYDPVSANRAATRAAMYTLGFRKTETVPTLENFLEAVQKAPPDIVLNAGHAHFQRQHTSQIAKMTVLVAVGREIRIAVLERHRATVGQQSRAAVPPGP